MALKTPPKYTWRERLKDGPLPPWFLALFLVTCLVTPGMMRLESLNHQLKHQADALAVQVDRNDQQNDCLIAYSKEMTEALRQRDGVSSTELQARSKVWGRIDSFIKPPPKPGVGPLLLAIDDYRGALDDVIATKLKNPYPDVQPCLTAKYQTDH